MPMPVSVTLTRSVIPSAPTSSHAQRTITSELLRIPGIGPARRRVLLERFGSLAGVRTATPAEIAALPGFSGKLADRILDRLHPSQRA